MSLSLWVARQIMYVCMSKLMPTPSKISPFFLVCVRLMPCCSVLDGDSAYSTQPII